MWFVGVTDIRAGFRFRRMKLIGILVKIKVILSITQSF